LVGGLRFEICIDSIAGAIAARQGGAQRVELCSALSVGGTTPSAAMIRHSRAACDLGLHVLIRPRGGDFVFDTLEWQVMETDVELAGEWGADGVVIGGLRADGSIDTDRCARLIERARPMTVTFHRAIDVCAEAESAVKDLVDLGVERVLTSGQASTAHAGRHLIRRMVDATDGRLIVMAGAGVDEQNAAELIRDGGVHELHFSARRRLAPVVSPTPAGGAQMGSDASADTVREETDPDRIRAIIDAATVGRGR
jgi:copper homeostasis protein